MSKFNRHLKENRTLVFLTIFLFLYMSWFSYCGKSDRGEKTAKGGNAKQIAQTNMDLDKKEESRNRPTDAHESAKNIGQKRPVIQEELNRLADKLDRYFQAVQEAVKEIPRDSLDPQAIVDSVGKEPEALFQWVRDHTYLVPYRGVLRGPIGVLMDRLGNSLDRALLLQDLLRLAGWKARLARATLTERQAEQIFRTEESIIKKIGPQSLTSIPTEKINQVLNRFATKYDIDFQRMQNWMAQYLKDQKKLEESFKERVDGQVAFIVRAVENYLNKTRNEDNVEIRTILTDHWWVQLERGDSWFDLDVALPEGQPGKALLPAEKNYEISNLDEALFHRVKIRILAEKWENGIFKESVALDYSLKPYEFIGKQIVLCHIPLNWPKDMMEKGMDLAQFESAVADEKEWLPCLLIDSKKVIQSSLTATGEINKNPEKAQKPTGPGALIGGIMGALGGNEGEKESEKKSQLSAEWLEYEIYAPGRPIQKERRKIFDLVQPVSRKMNQATPQEITPEQKLERGLSLTAVISILPLVGYPSPAFFLEQAASRLIANKSLLIELIRNLDSMGVKELSDKINKFTTLPGPEFSWAWMRSGSFLSGFRTYLDHVNIVNYLRGLRKLPGQVYEIQYGIDIVENGVAPNPYLDSNPFQLRIEQGVLDTNFEALAIKKSGEYVDNTSELFEESKKQGVDWLILNDVDDPKLEKMRLEEYERKAIQENMRSGSAVIAPSSKIPIKGKNHFGWWKVDLKNGSTLGKGGEGRGQADTEYLIMVAAGSINQILLIPCVVKMLGPKADKVNMVLCSLGIIMAFAGSFLFAYYLSDFLLLKTLTGPGWLSLIENDIGWMIMGAGAAVIGWIMEVLGIVT